MAAFLGRDSNLDRTAEELHKCSFFCRHLHGAIQRSIVGMCNKTVLACFITIKFNEFLSFLRKLRKLLPGDIHPDQTANGLNFNFFKNVHHFDRPPSRSTPDDVNRHTQTSSIEIYYWLIRFIS